MADMMMFPNTVEEFMEQYKIVDTEKIYTNGADLVPIFRMMQWFEHVSATDTISRQAALDIFDDYNVAVENGQIEAYSRDRKRLCDLPPAQLGTNLAEVGTDTISRKQAIDALKQQADTMSEWSERYAEQRRGVLTAVNIVEDLPPAQPEIIRCKDCQHSEYDAVYGDRYCHHNGKAEIVPDNHYCGYGERRTE